MSASKLLNIIRQQAARVDMRNATTRMGVVSAYDKDNFAAKVTIEPEGHESGWLPIASEAAGNGWGILFAPTIGEVVDVHFQEGGQDAGYISKRFFGDVNKPPAVPSGEFWVVHKEGGCLKFMNGGRVELSGGDLHLHATHSLTTDCNGYGQTITHTGGTSWTITNYVLGATVTSNNVSINPPEIP